MYGSCLLSFLLSVLFLSVVSGFYLNIYLMIKIAGNAINTTFFAVSSVRHAKLGLGWNMDASFFSCNSDTVNCFEGGKSSLSQLSSTSKVVLHCALIL